MLDALNADDLHDYYGDPRQTLESLARMLGVSCSTVQARLSADADKYQKTQQLRARRIHEMTISALYEDPEYIVDAAGNRRIDPSWVALQRYRNDAGARLAGILDKRLADRAQIEVTHTASPLADYIQRIAQQGAAVPIATIDGHAYRVDDVDDMDRQDDRAERKIGPGGT